MGGGQPSRRKIFLLNKPFQLRFAFYVCSFLFALSFGYPLILSNTYDIFIRSMQLDPSAPAITYLEATRQDLLWMVLLMEGVFLSLAFVISIFMSHRIAGPLFKLGRYFRDARDGNTEQKLAFRKTDYFRDLVGDYNAMMDSINARIRKPKDGIQQAIPKLEQALQKASPEIRADLESALTALKNGLKN